MFHTFIYQPLYNGIIILEHILPWADLGVLIIIFTLIIRGVLSPLSLKSVKTQIMMKKIQPKLKEIQEQYKNDKEQQARKTMALYKESGVNPFSTILLLFIQLPIIFGLYFVFVRGGLPQIDTQLLYSFITNPGEINHVFFGIIDMTQKSVVLSILAGVAQFVQARFAMPQTTLNDGEKRSFATDFAKSMQVQMKYVFPVIVAVISYTLSAGVALYWTTSSLFMVAQEVFVTRKLRAKHEKAA